MISAAPGHSRRNAVTVPLRHLITTADYRQVSGTLGTTAWVQGLGATPRRKAHSPQRGGRASMSKRRTERLLSIVVLLLSSRRYLTAEQIRAAVHGYPEQYDAFKRMFERDKDELRDLGIPLETGMNNPLDEEPGYRIRQQDYELPEIRLEADEAAVLGIAARVWQSAEFAGAAAGALLKLRAAGAAAELDDDQQPRPAIEPRLTTAEPAFGPLWEAVRDRRPVTFSYKAQGRSDAAKRELEPWGVV